MFQGYRIVYLFWDPFLDWFEVLCPDDPAQPKQNTMYVWNGASILQMCQKAVMVTPIPFYFILLKGVKQYTVKPWKLQFPSYWF